MSEDIVKVVAHLTAHKEKVAEMIQVLTAAIPATRLEQGCIAYDLFQNTADASQFTFVEEWENNDCLGAHLTSPNFQELSGKLGSLRAAAPDIRVFKQIM